MENDPSLKRLLLGSRFWVNVQKYGGAHFFAVIRPARPLSFLALVVGSVRKLLNSEEALRGNQDLLIVLVHIKSEGQSTLRNSASLQHIVRRSGLPLSAAACSPLTGADRQSPTSCTGSCNFYSEPTGRSLEWLSTL